MAGEGEGWRRARLVKSTIRLLTRAGV